MTLEKALLLFSFLVFTAFVLSGLRWLLNQPSDLLLIVAGGLLICYGWIATKSKAFTKNPFK